MPKEVRLFDLLRSLSVGQAWTVGGAILGASVALFWVGGFVKGIQDQSSLNEKQDQISKLTADNIALKASDNVLSSKYVLLDQKSEFLNRYVTYLLSREPADQSRNIALKLLVDYVHGMWREQQQRRITLTTERTQVSPLPYVGRFPSLQKAQFLELIKIVTFSDGSSYQLPAEVAVAVHQRSQ